MAAEVNEPAAATAPALVNAEGARQERRHLARRQIRALLLVAPLLLFLLFAFFAPIATMLFRSVHSPAVAQLIPNTTEQLAKWDGVLLPEPFVFDTLAAELKTLAQERRNGVLAAAVNQAYPGASSLINTTARKMRSVPEARIATQGTALLTGADKRWADLGLWRAVKQVSRVYTIDHYLTALDLQRSPEGEIRTRDSARIYLQLYGRTLGMALTITLLCGVLGYPLAYYLTHASSRLRSVLLVLVLLPFWTSLLVRTTAWIALLQTHGVVNSILQALHLTSAPLEMMYTRFATVIAMTHILLPFMILPLYSVMRGIDSSYMRAAVSLGSSPWHAFQRVYFPLSLPGLSAGSLLVFIVSVGYYITPALVGGTDGQMIANLIAFHMQSSNNWGLAAALGGLLLVLILILYGVYDRLVGANKITLA